MSATGTTVSDLLKQIEQCDQNILDLELTGDFSVSSPDCEKYEEEFKKRDELSKTLLSQPVQKYSLFAA